MEQQELIPHLFRTEFRKIVAVLGKHFGAGCLEVAEDLASDTFAAALETWPYRGVPANPTAWLYAVARNKALNYLRRHRHFAREVAGRLQKDPDDFQEWEIDLSEGNIRDSQLQMLFAICHPAVSVPAQVGLALRILCGFGIDEIATAFLTNKETINKRLFRARDTLRREQVAIEFPGESEIGARLNAVLTTLYLLFSEGYYSESREPVIREDLCAEAMRLTALLLDNQPTNTPEVHALYALMSFQASRLGARQNDSGELILYQDQDESRWDAGLISQGARHLNAAARGSRLSRYHLEAGIAYWHTIKGDTREKWENILQLYNLLLQVAYSPVAALNRTYAFSKIYGKEAAIREAERLKLSENPYYFTLLGELYSGLDDEKARMHFEQALELARTEADRRVIQQRLGIRK
ncbi:MAG TPA: sigma-70 family RNA polymerase sigma factor [Flavilitoribacter sp.]|nr:sigma-70 family RNA polymerase sigma factor [Flavilitoribacter sp.]HMQ87302.1 sigma-70 family RNA polymerase sigma factor [Flavilitoribacter sp.]